MLVKNILLQKKWFISRLPVFVLDIILVVVGIVLYHLDQMKFIGLLYSPLVLFFCFIVLLLNFYPIAVNGLLRKYCNKNTADAIAPLHEDITKMQSEIKRGAVVKVEKKDTRKFLKSGESEILKNLYSDYKEKKYKKLILRIRNLQKKKEDVRYNILLELVFSEQNTEEYDMHERIDNLACIIKTSLPSPLRMQFILTYIGCNLFEGAYPIVEKAIYKAITMVKKEQLEPSFLYNLYRLQMDCFVLQNRISEAVSCGMKALEYADDKDNCLINYNLSKIYFYFLNDNRLSLDHALSAWNYVYKDFPFVKELVQLCYITLFVDGQINEACDFLSNFVVGEKDDSYKDNLSYLLYKIGEVKRAEDNAKYCVSQNRREAVASVNTLAMIEMRRGEFEKAIYNFTEAIEGLKPNSQIENMKRFWLEAVYNRGVCYLKVGNFAKAKDDLDLAINERYTGIDADILQEYYEMNPACFVG